MAKMRASKVGVSDFVAAPTRQHELWTAVEEQQKLEQQPPHPEDKYAEMVQKLKAVPLNVGQQNYGHPTLNKLMAIPKKASEDSEDDSEAVDDESGDSESQNSDNDETFVSLNV